MSSLSDFVNEQRNKSSITGRSYFNVAQIGSKMTTSFSGFFKPINSSSTDDAELLTAENGSVCDGQLPSTRNRKNGNWFPTSWSLWQSEENYCGLSRFQRLAAFFLCVSASAFCFAAALMLIPVLVLQTRKFAALNTLGSTFFIISFGFIWGPAAYMGFLLSAPRRFATLSYLGSVLLTLYSSLWLHNTVLTIVAASIQAVALLWYLLSYVPGGEAGLKFMVKMCTSTVNSRARSTMVLPI